MQKTVIGVFQERERVESAINELHDEGFDPKDVSIVMKDKREAQAIGDNTGADVADGAVSGITTGAVVGGLAGLVAGILIPGLGAFLVGGPIAAALGLTGAAASTVSGAATGALAGGLIGVLMSLGLSQDDAELYQGYVEKGAILVAVPSGIRDASFIQRILEKYDATDVKVISHEESTRHARRADFIDDEGDTAEVIDRPEATRTRDYGYMSAGAKGGETRRDKESTITTKKGTVVKISVDEE